MVIFRTVAIVLYKLKQLLGHSQFNNSLTV